MTDRELLELAARAAGYKLSNRLADGGLMLRIGERNAPKKWNPLTDDGDALRLAVKLQIGLDIYNGHIEASWCDFVRSEEKFVQEFCDEAFQGLRAKEAATRSAITRAAAEIGKAMKEASHG